MDNANYPLLPEIAEIAKNPQTGQAATVGLMKEGPTGTANT